MPVLSLAGRMRLRASRCPHVNRPDWMGVRKGQAMRVSLRVKLTDRFVKLATTDGRKSPIFMDDEVIGFGVQVRETGRKSFTLDYMFEGRRRRLYIGDFPDWSTNAAREHAKAAHRIRLDKEIRRPQTML